MQKAGEEFGKIMFTDGYVLGGAANTPDIAFGDAPAPMFENPPKCWLHRQASFINSFFPETAVAGVDYDWFSLPPIDQEGTLYAGELTVVGKNANRAEVVDFLKRFIAEDVQCAMGGVTASSRISPNVNVGKDCYANAILADASVVLSDALKTGHGPLRRLGPDACRGGQRLVLDGDGELRQERSGLPRDRPAEHREELASVVTCRSTLDREGAAAAAAPSLNHEGDP